MTDIPEPSAEDMAVPLIEWYSILAMRKEAETSVCAAAIRRAYHAERKLAALEKRDELGIVRIRLVPVEEP